MSTRSKAAALKAATSSPTPIAPVSISTKPALTRGKGKKSIDLIPPTTDKEPEKKEKENGKTSTAPVKTKRKAVAVSKTSVSTSATRKPRATVVKKVACITCKQPDHGDPMVFCHECEHWYDFGCVGLHLAEADEISVYICPTCTEKTGRRTVMDWEGTGAFEEVVEVDPASLFDDEVVQKQEPLIQDEGQPEPPSASEGSSSEDEYMVAPKTKRPARRLSFSSDDTASDNGGAPSSSKRRMRRASTANTNGLNLKRKSTQGHPEPPPSKKKKASSNSASVYDDSTRKYCLGKLEEVFAPIFLRYPRGGEETVMVTDEEKARLSEEAKKFSIETEQCLYDTYSEPDKQGDPSAGPKYKERFRMLQFNLSKSDRVVIHKRIASLQITAKELSVMSSTDLANEETKQSIKIAEKEALEHSILQKTQVPRAKITHKGFEDIEDLNPETSSARRAEDEEEERREKERRDRVRAVSSTQLARERSSSIASAIPESPVASQNPTWGAPPPLPTHGPDYSVPMSSSEFSSSSSMFMDGNELGAPEMNLADLINIDEDPQDVSVQQPIIPSSVTSPIQTSPTAPTGISPFAANAGAPPVTPVRSASFDLNSFWSAPKTGEQATDTVSGSPNPVSSSPSGSPAQDIPEAVMTDFGPSEAPDEGADDQDFDMFLEERDQDAAIVDTSPEALRAAFENLAPVWSGMISMPLDSTIPQETPVVARQVGGRKLETDSPLWRTLFPTKLLRIDGRVPVESSAQFLLQMRMNSTKELMAAAFVAGPNGNSGFRILTDFLIAKGRHGLVFPWGNRPKDYHPGKELYIIPLLSSEPLPDYMELLDDLRLPKSRIENYLVGIWVLNKGKLAPPPHDTIPAPVHTAVPPSVPAAATIPQPQPTFEQPVLRGAPPEVFVASQPSTSSTPPTAMPLPLPITLPPSLNIEPSALAAEVASLTDEQIQMMLRTLSSALPALSQPQQPQLQPPVQQQPQYPTFNPGQWQNPGFNQQQQFQPPPTNFNYNQPAHNQPAPYMNGPPQQQFNQRGGFNNQQRGNDYNNRGNNINNFSRNNQHDRRGGYGQNNNNRGQGYDRGGNPGQRRGGRGGQQRGRGQGQSGNDFPTNGMDSGWAQRRGSDGPYNN